MTGRALINVLVFRRRWPRPIAATDRVRNVLVLYRGIGIAAMQWRQP